MNVRINVDVYICHYLSIYVTSRVGSSLKLSYNVSDGLSTQQCIELYINFCGLVGDLQEYKFYFYFTLTPNFLNLNIFFKMHIKKQRGYATFSISICSRFVEKKHEALLYTIL